MKTVFGKSKNSNLGEMDVRSFTNILIKMLLITSVITGCAITNSYGPYMGKVVDKESNEPLEGTVVFMVFYTTKATLAGGVSSYYDAIEVLTDSNGEFLIDPPRSWRLPNNLLESWDDGQVIIFKPGYGAYPGHKESGPLFIPNGALPENQHVTIKIPKLKTVEERALNLHDVTFTADIPYEKWRHLFEARNIECNFIGIEPWPSPQQ
jgi:hypothetical protein